MKNKFLLSAIALLLFGATLSAQPATSLSVNGASGFSFENGTITILNGNISVEYSDATPPQPYVFGNVSSLAFQTPIITWVGGTTDWKTTSNWDKNRMPGAGDYVIIPAGTSIPVLSENETVGMLFIENGASIDLNDFSITAKIITGFTVAAGTWYPIGFPYSIGALYGYGYAADGYNPGMLPYSDTPYQAGYYGDYIAKSYNGTAFDFTQTPAPAQTGYIYQFQPDYYGSNSEANKISFFSAGTSVTVSESDLEIASENIYYLLANPTLKEYEVTQGEGAGDIYYYQYNNGQNKFERPETDPITFAPFEAFVAIRSSNPAILLSSLSIDVVTALPVVEKEKVVATQYYNLQGVQIPVGALRATPLQPGIYIVKTIYASGKSEVSKIIK
ncbi:hypothetical protein FACS189413_04970 [Bacteroidia bacterium]|nr:hypothetical protein FACS189413_04970 [Bacteroidia bacterium]